MSNLDLENFDYHKLKNLNDKQLSELAKQIREEIILDVSKNGGHLSSNLGIVELTISLLKIFDPLKDDILFDVGHQCYTYKILTGRNLKLLRLNNGISGFLSKDESIYDKYTSGHSGSALGIGLGLATYKKITKNNSHTIIVVGDASLANGVSFETLTNLNNNNFGKVLIILNDNQMSISQHKGGTSSLFSRLRNSYFYQNGALIYNRLFNNKYLSWFYKFTVKIKDSLKRLLIPSNLFESMNISYLGPIDGYSFKKLNRFITHLANLNRSSILQIETKKGKGYLLAENDKNGYYHGVGPFNPKTGLKFQLKKDFSYYTSQALYQLMEKEKESIIITPAMIIGGKLENIFKSFPNRSFDVGISEESSLNIAAGFALKGKAIVEIYSCFMQRAYDQLLNELSLMNLKALIVIERAGLTGQDGPSHQGIFDMDLLLSLPNGVIYQPRSANEISKIITSYDFNDLCFVRIEKENDGLDLDIVTNYKLLNKSLNSTLILIGVEANKLVKEKLDYNIVELVKLRPIDDKLLQFLLTQKEIILVNSSSTSTYASFFNFELTKLGYKGSFKTYSLERKFNKVATKQEQLKDNHLNLDYLLMKLKK